MRLLETGLRDVRLMEPQFYEDARGLFYEVFREDWFRQEVADVGFVQENHSVSARGVLRGLHYQLERPQGKLVRVVAGAVFDVVVDMRRDSPDFGRWTAVVLSAENRRQLWVPPGFAHGFCVLGGGAEMVYRCTEYYRPQSERVLLWSDSVLAIPWPLVATPLLSEKDAAGTVWAEADYF